MGKLYYFSELLDCQTAEHYVDEPQESIQNWFAAKGDIDDFIFYDTGEKICSEK